MRKVLTRIVLNVILPNTPTQALRDREHSSAESGKVRLSLVSLALKRDGYETGGSRRQSPLVKRKT